jgi:hypothetical protein
MRPLPRGRTPLLSRSRIQGWEGGGGVERGVLKEEMVAEWGPVRADSGLVPHRPKLMLEFDAVGEGEWVVLVRSSEI